MATLSAGPRLRQGGEAAFRSCIFSHSATLDRVTALLFVFFSLYACWVVWYAPAGDCYLHYASKTTSSSILSEVQSQSPEWRTGGRKMGVAALLAYQFRASLGLLKKMDAWPKAGAHQLHQLLFPVEFAEKTRLNLLPDMAKLLPQAVHFIL